ncbi:MAG: hypothetical protein NT005_16355 [Spirochaetes bacterium]|nr:hypothetical protein [Spirochaetota bacterium]
MRYLYAEFAGVAGDILISVLVKLAAPDPYDLTDVDLREYKGIIPPRNGCRWRSISTTRYTGLTSGLSLYIARCRQVSLDGCLCARPDSGWPSMLVPTLSSRITLPSETPVAVTRIVSLPGRRALTFPPAAPTSLRSQHLRANPQIHDEAFSCRSWES